jgi:hypothetical protein
MHDRRRGGGGWFTLILRTPFRSSDVGYVASQWPLIQVAAPGSDPTARLASQAADCERRWSMWLTVEVSAGSWHPLSPERQNHPGGRDNRRSRGWSARWDARYRGRPSPDLGAFDGRSGAYQDGLVPAGVVRPPGRNKSTVT